jgi:hypothetical protein
MKRAANPAYFCCQCQVENCTQKFTTSCQYFNRGVPGEIIISVVELSKDVIPRILSFLPLKEIMPKRRVCKKWNEVVKMTIVPLTDFRVDSVEKYNAMAVMTRVMPNLQQIAICGLGFRSGHKYSDGEDPNEEWAARTSDYTTHDIEIISNFSKLRILDIYYASLNGRYSFLFNSFPLLQKLRIQYCHFLKWDLGMLAGFPVLEELECMDNRYLTGNINSLRFLKNTLEKVHIRSCMNVEGNFMDLADFPRLKQLNLTETAVTGDIRDFRNDDFSSLELLDLPKGVSGGRGYRFQHIADAPDLIRAVYHFKKKHMALFAMKDWYAALSGDSPDWYGPMGDDDEETLPFFICFVKAASRSGYRWKSIDGDPCEVNWLDPEPNRESSDYEKYIEESQKIDSQVTFYRGFHQPPSEEEYHSIWEENVEEIGE